MEDVNMETDAAELDTDKNSGAEGTVSATSGLHSPLFGTMIHRLMEVMVSSGNKGSAEDLAAGILCEYQTEDDDAELLERNAILKFRSATWMNLQIRRPW